MWRVGTSGEVAWIEEGTTGGRTINAAIPLVFEAYATIVLPGDDEELERHERAVLALLSMHSTGQPWWLGYLDAMPGGRNVIFPDAPMVTVFYGWRYVLVEAGPEQVGLEQQPQRLRAAGHHGAPRRGRDGRLARSRPAVGPGRARVP